MSYFCQNDLKKLGFKHLGKSVLISDKVSFYNQKYISISDYSRIDDFCLLSSSKKGIKIGRNVHLSVGVTIVGKGAVTIGDFSALSVKVSVFSGSDDFSRQYMINPTVDCKYTNVNESGVLIGKQVVVGASSVILPGVTIEDGVAIGALSLVKSRCSAYGIFAGIPSIFIKKRSKKLLDLEKKFLNEKV